MPEPILAAGFAVNGEEIVSDASQSGSEAHTAAQLSKALRDLQEDVDEARPYPEVAARLGMPMNTVKSDIHRYRRRFRELLCDEIARGGMGVIYKARVLDVPQKDSIALRHEAVACLGDFVGLTPLTLTDFPSNATLGVVHMDPTWSFAAFGLKDGSLMLRQIASGAEVARLPMDYHSQNFCYNCLPETMGDLRAIDSKIVVRFSEPDTTFRLKKKKKIRRGRSGLPLIKKVGGADRDRRVVARPRSCGLPDRRRGRRTDLRLS